MPAGFVLAKWIGPYDVTVPDREVLGEDGQPTGEVILAAHLVSGEDSHVVPEGEAKRSRHWKPLSAKRVSDAVARTESTPLPTPVGAED